MRYKTRWRVALQWSSRPVSYTHLDVYKRQVLESAIANAEHNEGADIDELKVATICVACGPLLKRMHARAKGRGNRIVKRTSHITVTVAEN